MKDVKGFTLIELLAVIVILAIIALIASPIIIGLINDARKESFKNSAYGIQKAGEILYSGDLLNGTIKEVTFTYTEGVETSSIEGKKLNYNGSKPNSGTVVVNDKGNVALIIYNGKYCAVKGFYDKEVTLLDKTEEECISADKTGASFPELAIGMIPIKWDKINNEWVKADVNNVLGPNQWYDYDNQEWANAVLVTEATRDTYKSASTGTTINEADVLAYLVWVPRYKYAIPNDTGVRNINIAFESKAINKSDGNAIDTNYHTHPAFTFGNKEVNGIWVGKFETTGNITSMTIKPNLGAINDQSVSSYFTAVRNMEIQGNVYGLQADEVDIHMMKNSEWGAVAYLSNSKYGKYGNSLYTGAVGLEKEIYVNNNNSNIESGYGPTITGCAGNSVSATMVRSSTCPVNNSYQTTQGVKASTTGNTYGIYDMSGGTPEFIMGNVNGYVGWVSSDTTQWHSGFNGPLASGETFTNGIPLPGSKYYDLYPVSSVSNNLGTACQGNTCYGHALSETAGWNEDLIDTLVNQVYPWFVRGGGFSSENVAGIFSLEGYCGHPQGMTIRVAITLE